MAKKKSRTSRRTGQAGDALPQFNFALGEFLALPKHLEQKYSDVVTQIFPLKANMGRLQDFCDTYLNLSEDAPLYFKPVVPWVLMQVVDYGRIAVTSKNGSASVSESNARAEETNSATPGRPFTSRR